MPLSIAADFILGFYQGRDTSGGVELFPTPLRLYSALTAGAFSLERQEGLSTDKGLSDEDINLFSWFEQNPPDAIELPSSIKSQSTAIAYRNCGEVKGFSDRGKKERIASEKSFLSGPITWFWNEGPAEQQQRRLEAIAQEVPYLGEAESPVRLLVENRMPSDTDFYRCAPSFSATRTLVAAQGRSNELQNYYLNASHRAKDKHLSEQIEQTCPPPSSCISSAYYQFQSNEQTDTNSPWQAGFLLDIDESVIEVDTFTTWATCLHRALAKYVGDSLPSIMQGPDKRFRSRPNGLAIQLISRNLPIRDDYRPAGTAILVMIPTDAPIGEESLIVRALSQIKHLYSRQLGNMNVCLTGERIDLSHFWKPVPSGCRRLFETHPLFISNSRPPTRSKDDGSRWSVEDDARIAIGYVWRDIFGDIASGDVGRVSLSRSVEEKGVSVCGGRIVPTEDIRRFVHRTNKGSMLVGERAIIDLSVLGCDEAITAIGQTRHLGGGLLVPFDISDSPAHISKDDE